MLNNKYFTDAFVLHDRTNFYPHIEKMLMPVGENSIDYSSQIISSVLPSKNDDMLIEDKRKNLQLKWASFKNIFKFQPLNLIRDYFGEGIYEYD